MPTASARTFGVQSMAENYGLLFSNSVREHQLLYNLFYCKSPGGYERSGGFEGFVSLEAE